MAPTGNGASVRPSQSSPSTGGNTGGIVALHSCPRRPDCGRDRYDFAFVGSPPIPPHERTWRHPSELAAAEWHAIRHTEPQRTTRGFAIATGTMGLVAVAVLTLTVTPGTHESPVAISATTSPVSTRESAIRTPTPTTAPALAPAPSPAGARAVADALATPIGDGHLALMTVSAVAAT